MNASLLAETGPYTFEIGSPAPGSPTRERIWAVDPRTNPPKREDIGEVVTIPSHTTLYHWGPEAMKEWAAQGFPDDAGMQARRAVSGYYLATGVTGWGYGPVLIAYDVLKPIRLSHLESMKASAYFDHSLPYSVALMQWEDRVGLDGHDDGFDSDGQLAVNHPDQVVRPHLATVEDVYRSAEFQQGKLQLMDFLWMEGNLPFRSNPELARHYPLVAKLLEGYRLTPAETHSLQPQIPYAVDAIGGLLQDQRTLGALAEALHHQFAANPDLIDMLKNERPYLVGHTPSPQAIRGLEYLGYPASTLPEVFAKPVAGKCTENLRALAAIRD